MHGLASQVLLISPEPWHGHFVSKHHYAITLANRGYRVYFLNPPNNMLKSPKIEQTEYENLWQITAPQVAKGLRFYPKMLRKYVERRWLEHLERRIGNPFTTVWLFENSRFYSMDFAHKRTKIYHQVDANQNFHVKEAASSADICFCVTDFIRRDLLAYHQNVFKIFHGIDLESQKTPLSLEQRRRFTPNRIHVAYVGNLDMHYIDEDIVYTLVQKHADIMFHFVGGYTSNGALYKMCKAMNNVVWWGKVESTLILSILEKIDVCLLVYRAEAYREQLANSHKIMEYLASGKVTVATYTDEYKDKRALLEMVDDSGEYVAKFDEVVAHLELYHAKEKQKQRVAFAKEHSYEKQLDKIFVHLAASHLAL